MDCLEVQRSLGEWVPTISIVSSKRFVEVTIVSWQNAIVVHCSQDEPLQAVLKAVKSGHLGGLGLDVHWGPEPAVTISQSETQGCSFMHPYHHIRTYLN